MDRLKKVLAAFLIIALALLPLSGCRDKAEHPSGGEHPSEHPAVEVPSEEAVEEATEEAVEAVEEDAPAPEHPEHPQ